MIIYPKKNKGYAGPERISNDFLNEKKGFLWYKTNRIYVTISVILHF